MGSVSTLRYALALRLIRSFIYVTGRSKLANILFAKQLQKEFGEASSTALSLSLHPGWIQTDTVVNNLFALARPFARILLPTALDGATIIMYAATAPEVRERRSEFAGAYLSGGIVFPSGKITNSSNGGEDPVLAQRLWEVSENITNEILARA